MSRNNPPEQCKYCLNNGCLNYFDSEFKIIRCKECNVLFREKFDNTKYHIKKISYTPNMMQRFRNKITHEKFWKLISNQYVQYLQNKTDMSFKTAFDVGAQYGTFVKSLNKLGIDTYGIESNEEQIQYSVIDKIESGYFDENFKTDKKFDLISLTEMIYYLPDNLAVLKMVKEMLTDNGMIFISSINPESTYNDKISFGDTHNVILSRKNYESLESKMGLRLLDYTTLKTNILYDMRKKFTMLLYFSGMKKPYILDANGNHVFLLLKKVC